MNTTIFFSVLVSIFAIQLDFYAQEMMNDQEIEYITFK